MCNNGKRQSNHYRGPSHYEDKHHDKCFDCLKANCGKIKQIISNDICAQQIEVKDLFVEDEVANNICVPGKLKATHFESEDLNTNSLCAQSATITDACITNLNATNFSHNVLWRAVVTNPNNSLYSLGSPLNWSSVIDDPNSNVSLAPFNYMVPRTGYYILTFQLESDSLTGNGTISGIPVGLLSVMANGNPLRQQTSPFLSFSNAQSANLTSLCLLTAGDLITMTYDVLVFDPISGGIIKYVGTINIKANGTFYGQSGFAIHYLSSFNGTTPVTCPSCPRVVVDCNAVLTPCMPLHGEEPCDSCQ